MSADPWQITVEPLSSAERRMLLAIRERLTDGQCWVSWSPRLGRMVCRYKARRHWATPIKPLNSEELAACTWLALGGYVTNSGELTERGRQALGAR